jgi:hypothetical protein
VAAARREQSRRRELPGPDSDPAITFTAIDDRGQEQQSITFLGTFSRCDDPCRRSSS